MFCEGSFELEVDAIEAEDVEASAACADGDGFVVVLELKVKGEIAVGEGERRDIFVFADIPSDDAAIIAAGDEQGRAVGLDGKGRDGFSEVSARKGGFESGVAGLPNDDIAVATGGDEGFSVCGESEP